MRMMLIVPGPERYCLLMPETSGHNHPEDGNSFASMLASFSSGKGDGWDDSLLASDVASITYEHALRPGATPAAVRAAGEEIPLTRPAELCEAASGCKKRKTASVTIRLTEYEQKQLQERAAEAGLSVSAYLRSCIFEAESLRAQVKEALSEMRATSKRDDCAEPGEETPGTRRRVGWFSRWTHRRERSA